MDPSPMENLGGVDISDTRHNLLIEQSDFHRTPAPLKSAVKFICRDRERIGPDPIGPNDFGQLDGRIEMERAQSSHAPEGKRRMVRVGELEDRPNMVPIWRFREQDPTGHARFEDNGILGLEIDHHTFGDTSHASHTLSFCTPSKDSLARRHFDVTKMCFREPHDVNRLPGNRGDSTAHGFDFRELRHILD